MRRLLVATGILYLAAVSAASAQQMQGATGPLTIVDLSKFHDEVGTPQIPQAVIDAIKATPNVQTVLPIHSSESFAQQVIKADDIVFDTGAHLAFSNLQSPWVAIVAHRIKFRDPSAYSFIERDMGLTAGATGADGGTGAKGADDFGETNRRGNDGHPGGAGSNGGPGETLQLPTVYIIAEKLLDDHDKEIPAGILNLAVLVRGIDGGMGGVGGRGGNGGHAGNGKEGASGAFDCKEGPGPGGNGGTSGPGGMGGPAGNGGNGATVIFVSLPTGGETFSYSRVNNQGGLAGLGGRGGAPGTPGAGGSGAGRNGWCGSSGPGSPGSYPNPANLGDGKPGTDGGKGEMYVVKLKDLSVFF